MQLLAAEHPCADSHCEGARTQRRHHHHVECFPDSPSIRIIHAADRSESGQLAIPREDDCHENEYGQKYEESVDDRKSEYRHISFPPSALSAIDIGYGGAHSCALNPVSFSLSCASSSCPLRFLRITCTSPAYSTAGSAKY